MSRRSRLLFEQSDFRGGIHTQPENASPNQVLDARNVWCPNGSLEQRPGSLPMFGINQTSQTLGSGGTTDTNVVWKSYDVNTSTWASNEVSTGPLVIAGLVAGDSIYLGFTAASENWFWTDAIPNTANTGMAWYLWDGTSWAALHTLIQYFRVGVSSDYAVSPYLLNQMSTGTSGEFIFTWQTVNSWALSTVNGTSAYWIKCVLLGDAPSVGAQFDKDEFDLVYAYGMSISSNAAIVGAHVSQFPMETRLEAVTEKLRHISTGGRLPSTVPVFSAERSATPTKKMAQDPSSFAAVLQFMETYSATSYTPAVFPAEPSASTTFIPAVETRPEYVGSIGGFKSDYHPDYVAQLSSWPMSKFVEFFHGQLWVANLLDEPYTVRWSAPQPAYKVWPAESYEYLIEDDNSPITGLKAFGEHLAVFKQDSIWRMVYNGVGGVAQLNTYTPTKVPGGIGTVSNSSIIDINGALVFLAEDGVYHFDGYNKPTKISGPVDDYIARIAPGRRNWAAAVHWRSKNCYMLAVPVDGSHTNNMVLVYDYKHGAWWIWDSLDVQCWLRSEGVADEEQVFACSSSGVVSLLGTGNNDNGTAISSYVKTHRFGHGDFKNKDARLVRLNCEDSAISSLGIELVGDDNDALVGSSGAANLQGMTLVGSVSVGASTLVQPTVRKDVEVAFRVPGEGFTVKLINTMKDAFFRIFRIRVEAKPEGSK